MKTPEVGDTVWANTHQGAVECVCISVDMLMARLRRIGGILLIDRPFDEIYATKADAEAARK